MVQGESYGHLRAREVVRGQIALELKAADLLRPFPNLSPHHLPTLSDLPYPDPPTDDRTIKLGIIGAGMAGLYVALIIDTLRAQDPPVLDHNVEYEILEASKREGGRCLTYKFSDEPHDYYDAGAMRFPEDTLMKRQGISKEVQFA